MKNQIDFQNFIPVSADKNINYERTRLISRNCMPVSADKNINYEEPD